jgi:hypothetical protein
VRTAVLPAWTTSASSQSMESNHRARGYEPRRCPAPTAKLRALPAVPPRGHDPLPASFANLCPVLGTVAHRKRSSRSGGNRTPHSFALNERTVRGSKALDRCLTRDHCGNKSATGIRGGICTRVAGSRNQRTNCCSTRTKRRASEWSWVASRHLAMPRCRRSYPALSHRAVDTQFALRESSPASLVGRPNIATLGPL